MTPGEDMQDISRLQLLLLVLLTAIAALASVHSWRAKLAYGLFRFLAFEALAILVVLNANRWFRDPYSLHQLASWTTLAAATVLAIHGVHLLRAVGRARARIMEETRDVVEVGVYRYIRHPVYSSLALFGWGVFFKGVDLPSACLAVAATILLVATARHEERFNIQRFGAAYSNYMKRTKMFIPFVL